jgi:DNA-binding IclR family transcriptional regulator
MNSGIKVVDKAFQVLNTFSAAKKNISLKELAQITQQNKSTLIRICKSLIKHDFLMKNSESGNYQLGPGSWRMGQIYNANFNIGREIKEILQELCNETGQSAGYWIRSGDIRVCLYRVNSTESELAHHLVEGSTFPLISATGKILLAFGDNNKQLMDDINKKGYAFTSDERLENLASVAVPVFNSRNEFQASLNVSGWKQFFTPKARLQFAEVLKDKQITLKKLLP